MINTFCIMDKMQTYRTALDALLFLLQGMPKDFLSEDTRIVLRKVVSDCMTEVAKIYDGVE